MRLSARRRVGSILSVELLFVLPILLALLLAMTEFSLLLSTEARYAHASREGARVAALGGDLAGVELAVRNVLGDGQFEASTLTVTPDISSVNNYPSGTAMEVIVAIRARQVVPDLLRFFGFSLGDQQVLGRTVMRRE